MAPTMAATITTAELVLATLEERQRGWLAGRAMASQKITDDEIVHHRGLIDVAVRYALGYQGTFEYMVDMARQAAWGLSIPQARGTLNCLLAEIRRAAKAQAEVTTPAPQAAAAPPAPLAPVTLGTFTLVAGDGSHRTIRLAQTEIEDNGRMVEVVCCSFLAGPDNESDYRGFAWIKAGRPIVWKRFKGSEWEAALVALLSLDTEALHQAGYQYALASGKCWRCGRTLTDPESIEFGIGPVCRDKLAA